MKINRRVNFNSKKSLFNKAFRPSRPSNKINLKINFGKNTDQLPIEKRRSLFESGIDSDIKKHKVKYSYETMIISWTDLLGKPHRYFPDYIVELKKQQLLFIEAKGLFDIGMLIKYAKVLEAHPELKRFFIIVWQRGSNILNTKKINMYDPDSREPTKLELNYVKVRKNDKLTYIEACNRLGINNIEYSQMMPTLKDKYNLK